MEPLEAIRVVLVRPTHSGNVGGVARAIKNMGLRHLHLVAPLNYPGSEAEARAAGATDLLAQAQIFPDIDQAIQMCHFVVGTTARSRRIGWPSLTPFEGAQRLIEEAHRGPVALLFGQERSGLTNEELDRCHMLVHIPANPEYPSLNLVCAAQILTYEIYQAVSRGVTAPPITESPSTEGDMNHFYKHLEEVLTRLRFLDPNNPRLLLRRLRRFFNRAQPDHNELNILRGILTSIEQQLEKLEKSK